MKNLFYLVLIDNGFVICSEKDGVAILPHIHFEETFKTKEEAKIPSAIKPHAQSN